MVSFFSFFKRIDTIFLYNERLGCKMYELMSSVTQRSSHNFKLSLFSLWQVFICFMRINEVLD